MDIWIQKNVILNLNNGTQEDPPTEVNNEVNQCRSESSTIPGDELDKICRGCMTTEEPNHFQPLFTDDLKSLYQECTGLKVEKWDRLPNVICLDCIKLCRSWIQFCAQCLDNQIKFKELLTGLQPFHTNAVDLSVQNKTDDVTKSFEVNEIRSDVFKSFPNDSDKHKHKESRDLPERSSKRLKSVSCVKCNEIFRSDNKLLKHCKTEHPGEQVRNYICDECDRGFAISTNLDRHKKSRHNVDRTRNKLCTHCGKLFFTTCHLNMHIERLHKAEDKFYKCTECFKTFKCVAALKSHGQWHKTHRQFACTICDKVFKHKTILQTHQLSHVEPQVCNKCGRSFKIAFSEHVKKCAGPTKDYRRNRIRKRAKPVCPICSLELASISVFSHHLQSVHSLDEGVDLAAVFESIKAERCEDCGKRYFDKYALQAHRNKVHRAKKVTCPNCGRWLRDQCSLQLHLTSSCIGVKDK